MKHIFAILATFVFFVGCEQLVAQQTDQRDQLSIETSVVWLSCKKKMVLGHTKASIEFGQLERSAQLVKIWWSPLAIGLAAVQSFAHR